MAKGGRFSLTTKDVVGAAVVALDGVEPNGVDAAAAGLETCLGGGKTLPRPLFDFGFFDRQKVQS